MFQFTIRRSCGFTLIELMIVVAIVAILAAIAIPSYQDSVRKGRRGDAKEELMRLAQAEEKWRVTHTSYGSLADLGGATASSYYTFSESTPTATAFSITATPTSTGGQNQDTCATLAIANFVVQGGITTIISPTITSSAPTACPKP